MPVDEDIGDYALTHICKGTKAVAGLSHLYEPHLKRKRLANTKGLGNASS
jgi:hypothetical protein